MCMCRAPPVHAHVRMSRWAWVRAHVAAQRRTSASAGMDMINEMFQKQARRLEAQLLQQAQDRKMLELAQPKLAALGTPFHVHTQYATEKRIGGESMKEFRVALIREREAGRRMSAPAGMAPTSEALENLERFMSGR